MKTLKVSNEKNAKSGDVEVQPSETGLEKLNQQSVPSSGKNTPPLSEQARTEAFLSSINTKTQERARSILDLAGLVSNPDAVVTTLRGSGTNNIAPANPNASYDSIIKENEKISSISKRIDSYEQFTGVSKERPEVVMLTDFLPLYSFSSPTEDGRSRLSYRAFKPTLTNAGRFFEQQINIRNLRAHNMKHLFAFNKKSSPGFRKLAGTRKDKFQSEMEGLSSISQYLLGIVRLLEGFKQRLDVKNDNNLVKPDEVLRAHLASYSQVKSSTLLKYLTSSLSENFLPKYDIHYVLGLFGFEDKKTKSYYTSTKNWMQLCFELKNVLSTHSLALLDLSYQQQKNDESSLKILKTPSITRFTFSTKSLGGLKQFALLRNLKISEISSTLQTVMFAYSQMYESVNFRSQEMRLAALANLISQEYRYSRGLGEKEVRNALSKEYGYTVSDLNNLSVFDYIIGQFGDNVTDILSLSDSSLTSVAQGKYDSEGTVLPLESRYIEGDRGTLIPGSEYFADSVLAVADRRYDISKLKQFYTKLSSTEKAFQTVVSGMNLLSSEYVDDNEQDSVSFSTRMNNPRMFFNTIRKTFIDDNGLPGTILQRDSLSTVFAMAHDEPKIKSLLFLYLMLRISRTYHGSLNSLIEDLTSSLLPGAETDNTPASEEIIRQLIEELVNKSKLSASSKTAAESKYKQGEARDVGEPVQLTIANNSYFVKVDSVAASLRSSSELLLSVERLLKETLTSFKANCTIPGKSLTRYGGHNDTLILMAVFDMVTTIISVYGNKRIVGFQEDDRQRTFIVQDRVDDHTRALNEIDGRISKEISIAQHAIFFILNLLRKLQNTAYNIMGYVNSPESLSQLGKIFDLLDSDANLLKILFTEQQIRLFANSVADVMAVLRPNSSGNSITGEDVDGDGDFDADDEMKILDDSVLSPKLRDAIESVMSTPEFSLNAHDHKIMTVGIPVGFVENLKQKIDLRKSRSLNLDARQNDIVKLKVYKQDMLNPDIIYKPKEFLFEMSRFVARADELIKPSTAQAGEILDVARRFPTRDYTQAFSSGGSDVQYIQSQKDESEALGSADYSFLTQKEKNGILVNHVVSYLLESYLKVMTSVSTADHHFDIVEPSKLIEKSFIENVTNNHMDNFTAIKNLSQRSSEVIQQGGMLFSNKTNRRKKSSGDKSSDGDYTNSAGTQGISPVSALLQYKDNNPVERPPTAPSIKTLNESLLQIKLDDMGAIVHQLGVINEFGRTLTPMANPTSVSKRLITPKMFDRVFNILVDPNSFEIDLDAVNRTPHGKQALNLLLNKGDVDFSQRMSTPNQASRNSTKRFDSRYRSKSQGDIMFEKYFVAIETIDGEEV